MKWRIVTNGEGGYWWEAKTPVGPIYVDFNLGEKHRASPWEVRWYPMDEGDGIVFGHAESEDAGKEGAEWHMRQIAKKFARWAK